MKASFLLIGLLSAGVAFAGPPAPHQGGIESKDYKWNAQEGEKIEALKLKGDKKNGEEAYEICGACHLPSGAGRPDGTFPQLAGQHTTVLIKQMADIRAGLRDNPTMYPFAATLTDPQELADVAEGFAPHFHHFVRQCLRHVHPAGAVTDADAAALHQIIGVQRLQERAFARTRRAGQRHAFSGGHLQRHVGQHRQLQAALLVQDKGFANPVGVNE